MRFHAEPALSDSPMPSGTGVLLCNLGSPDEPTAPALRRYLAQFLSDERVVESPRALWLPLLHGVILRTISVGGVLLSHNPTIAVPSAQSNLATGIGTGPGVSLTL